MQRPTSPTRPGADQHRGARLLATGVEQRVTYPIETALAGLPRLDYTRLVSRYGLSQVTVVFEDGTDLYFARQQVAERLQQIRSQIPKDWAKWGRSRPGWADLPVHRRRGARGGQAGRHAVDRHDLRTLQDWVIRPQMRNTPGVTEVNTIGGFERQIHITPDPSSWLHSASRCRTSSAVAANNQNMGRLH